MAWSSGSHTIAGLRVNEWTSLIAFAIAMTTVLLGRQSAAPDGDLPEAAESTLSEY